MTVDQYPVLEVASQAIDILSSHPVVILQAPPGAGKSTVLPLKLLSQPWLEGKKIVMLEPRRLAARAVAERMADLLNEDAGQTIGYRVRFDTKVTHQTKLEVVTEGILTRIIQNDNTLSDYGLVIFDEFHERSIHADLSLALTLQVQQILRSDLRILIMSATLDAEGLAKTLGNAPVVTSKGRQYPVEIRYAAQENMSHVTVQVANSIRKVCAEESGDILVFLPGAGEIKKVAQILEEQSVPAVVHPLYGDLSFRQQQQALLPRTDGLRKVVLSTSIAETSLTIEGIRIVIDAGLSRVPRFDPRSGLTRLETIRVTKDAADQRAGRAGRLGPGVCYRLWTQGVQLGLVAQRKPEILEADLAPLMLELAQWGIRDAKELRWITPPVSGALAQATELLQNLEALDESGITSRGREMLLLPTHPRIAHMILVAKDESASRLSLATDIAAILEEKDPLDREAGVDIGLRIEALRKFRSKEKFFADRNVLERIEKLAGNWRRIVKAELDNKTAPDQLVGKLLWSAYPERLARQQSRHSNRFRLAAGKHVIIPQHDPLIREPWICAAIMDSGTNEGKVFLAAPVAPEDLLAFADEKEIVRWDEERGMIVVTRERRLGPLILESKPSNAGVAADARLKIIAEQIRASEMRILGNVEERRAFQARVCSLHRWRPDELWPDMTDNYLMETVEQWIGPFVEGITRQSELEKLDIVMILKTILDWDKQQRIDQLAPTKLQVPSGSSIKVHYSLEGEPPVLEVRLQEMFGLGDTPTVNDGRIKVKLHLLSPGYKPVQVTQDLKSFWETTYHEVRKELRIRYPRHHWPEDPWTAEAVRGAKRRT